MGKNFILLIVFLIFGFGIFIWQGIYLPKISLTGEKLFLVEKGQNVFQIAENLEKEDLIKNRFFFDFYVLANGNQRNLQAGEYSLSPSLNLVEITKKIVSGDVVKLEVAIPEGFTIDQIEERLNEKANLWGNASGQIKIKNFKIRDFKDDYDFLETAPPNFNLQGFLFPATYQFSPKVSAEEAIRKMLEKFDKELTPDLREKIKRQEKSIFEIVIMASLLEKEVQTEEDKELVSGILWKRLENDIPLQVDATITYITGKRTTKISKEETQIDSPYNTYKYLGLPIGPICNPGLDSIKAAMYPEESEYWYYLSIPGGKTIFSETLEKHNLVKREYLK